MENSQPGVTSEETRNSFVAHLLRAVDFQDLEVVLRRLVYEITGGGFPSLIICDHPPTVTIGREGSIREVKLTRQELVARGWQVRWIARGGGTMLHLPGQVACYPVFHLPSLGISPAEYVRELLDLGLELCQFFNIPATADAERPGILVNGRRLIHVGSAIHNGVTTYGLVVNVCPDLELFRLIECDGDRKPMTSLQRECPTIVRHQSVRQLLPELAAKRFGFERYVISHRLPGFPKKTIHHAVTQRH